MDTGCAAACSRASGTERSDWVLAEPAHNQVTPMIKSAAKRLRSQRNRAAAVANRLRRKTACRYPRSNMGESCLGTAKVLNPHNYVFTAYTSGGALVTKRSSFTEPFFAATGAAFAL